MPATTTRGNKKGEAYSTEKIVLFQHLNALRKAQKGTKGLTMGQIQQKLSIGSRATLYRWAKMDMKLQTREQRKKRKGHRRLLSEHDGTILAGLICVRSELGFDTSANYIIGFMKEALGLSVRHRWVHDFAKRNRLSSRTAKPKEGNNKSQTTVREMVEFLKRVKNYNKAPHQIACLDKTGIYGTAKYDRQYGPKGG